MATADAHGRDYNENRGLDEPAVTSAVPSEGMHTTQPERGLEPGNPNLVGAKPAGEKQGMADKVKGLLGGVMKGHQKTSSGVGDSPKSTSHGTAAANEYTSHSLDPTAAPEGNNLREGDNKTRSGSPGPWPHPTNPRVPTGHTNAHGGATLHDEHGNLHPGPQADSVKKEGFLSKIMDKLHSPRSPKSQH